MLLQEKNTKERKIREVKFLIALFLIYKR